MIESAHRQDKSELRDQARPGRHLRSVPGKKSRGLALRRSSMEGVWDRHGSSLYTLACALLGDEAAATQAVTLAMTDLARSTEVSTTADWRAELVRGVYVHSQELVGDTQRTLGMPAAMQWLDRVAPLQRACLALCLFGGLTHRDAADLIGIPAVTVAELLTAGLRELAGSTISTPAAG